MVGMQCRVAIEGSERGGRWRREMEEGGTRATGCERGYLRAEFVCVCAYGHTDVTWIKCEYHVTYMKCVCAYGRTNVT